jgi:uncharacterized protein YjaG (DUF416 family)
MDDEEKKNAETLDQMIEWKLFQKRRKKEERDFANIEIKKGTLQPMKESYPDD